MMETERRVLVDDSYNPEPHGHLTTLTAPTTSSLMDLNPYSQAVTASYAQDLHHPGGSHHYYPEYDAWQQHGAAASAASLAAASSAAQDPSSGFYTSFGERPDLASVQLYHSFSTAVPSHHGGGGGGGVGGDLYAASPALWNPSGLVVDDRSHLNNNNNNISSHQRYLPSMTTRSASSSNSATSPTSSQSSSSSSSSTTAGGKPKRRRVQSQPQRKAANIRERRRMFHLNTAFDELRKRLPAFNYEKRLSRIETLRLAMTYIGFMKDVSLGEDPGKVKLRPGMISEEGSELSHLDLASVASEDPNHDDVDS